MMGAELPSIRKFECQGCKHVEYRMSVREVGEVIPGECPKCGGNLEVSAEGVPEWLVKPLGLVQKKFDILDVVASVDRIGLEVSARESKNAFRSILGSLRRLDYLPVMREHEGEMKLTLIKYLKPKPSRAIINVALFVATIITTFVAGYITFGNSILDAGLFSGALMLMLGSHELGHKISNWRVGVDSTMPYFIPGIPPLGTFGAVISVKSPIPTKEALVEMGASGPLTGFVLSVIITFLGLSLSAPNSMGIQLPFLPGMFAILQLVTSWQVSSIVPLNPLIFAGWVVLFVTMFNLIPAGQLDGGHIARAILGRERHFWLTRISGFSLVAIGLFLPDYPFWLWGFMIIFLFRGYHPGALDDISPLSARQKVLAALAFVVFLLCIPLPIQ